MGAQLCTPAMTQLKAFIIPVTPFQQNCSLVYDDERKVGAIVDPGGDVPVILDAIKQSGITIEKILLTHGHIDHAGGAAELRPIAQAGQPRSCISSGISCRVRPNAMSQAPTVARAAMMIPVRDVPSAVVIDPGRI